MVPEKKGRRPIGFPALGNRNRKVVIEEETVMSNHMRHPGERKRHACSGSAQ